MPPTEVPGLLTRLKERDLLLCDRNFCCLGFLLGILKRGASFLIREHALLSWQAAGKVRRLGRTEGGRLSEQRICIRGEEGQPVYLRRVVVELDKPTQDGDTLVAVLTGRPSG